MAKDSGSKDIATENSTPASPPGGRTFEDQTQGQASGGQTGVRNAEGKNAPASTPPRQPRVEPHEAVSDTFGGPESRRFGKRSRFKIAGTILLLAVLVIGFLVWRHYAGWETTDDAQVDAHIHAVSARLAGHVSKVYVDENQMVKAGDILAEIDSADYQVSIDRARAELADAQATAQAAHQALSITAADTASQLSSARVEVENNRAALLGSQRQSEAAQARLREAEANNAKAQADLARYRQLVQRDEISRQQYDQAVAAAKAAAASVDAARAGGSVAQQQIIQSRGHISEAQSTLQAAGTGPQQVAVTRARASAAEADIKKYQAALDQALLNEQYTRIIAPVNGVVGKKSVESGQNVQPGQEIMSIVPLDDIWITANFKETQLKKMHPGQAVQIHCDSTGKDYKGQVDSIGAASGARFSLLPPENATGNYVKVVQRLPVKIVLNQDENSDHALRPGMSVEPRVRVQ